MIGVAPRRVPVQLARTATRSPSASKTNYADTARILNEKGFRTGDSLPLTPIAVGYIRKAYSLKTRFERLREQGLLPLPEMARVCGVSTNTIGRWGQKA